MTIRWYLLPIETIENGRGPKYLAWRRNPEGLNVTWGMIDYGLMPVAIAWADVTNAQHNALTANGDVRAVPLNLDAPISAGAVVATRAVLEALDIPGNWVTTADTWRGILRATAGLFLFAQRVHGKFGVTLLPDGYTLATTWSELPQGAKTILLETALELAIDTSGATANTTLRQIYKALADAWGELPIVIGGQQL